MYINFVDFSSAYCGTNQSDIGAGQDAWLGVVVHCGHTQDGPGLGWARQRAQAAA